MATDNFLKIDGITGDSTVDGHVDEIELLGWQMGVSVPVGPRSGGGSGAAGTSMHSDFSFTKTLDGSSTDLTAACWVGKTIASAIVTVQKQGETGGGKVDYMRITLNDLIISSYSRSGGDSMTPSEQISFNYGKIKTEYFTTDAAGGSGGWQAKAWSVAEEKEV